MNSKTAAPTRSHSALVELAQHEGASAGRLVALAVDARGLPVEPLPPSAACVARITAALGHALGAVDALTLRTVYRLSHNMVTAERRAVAHECRFTGSTAPMPAHLRPLHNRPPT